jgi:Fe2+ transport system protein FeoA
MNLYDGLANKTYQIKSICGDVRQRLAELGFNPGCKIKVVNKHPNTLMVINCRESQIALRKQEAQCIQIEELNESVK